MLEILETRFWEHVAKGNDSDDKVRAIRESHALGHASTQSLAAMYGVNTATINKIIRRFTWKHVP